MLVSSESYNQAHRCSVQDFLVDCGSYQEGKTPSGMGGYL